MDDTPPNSISRSLTIAVDKSASVSRPAILRHIAQSRRSRPEATPEDIVRILGRRFTGTVTGTGAAAGATAAAPGVSTPISMALAAGDLVGFTTVAALYVFALAEIHSIPIEDLERRRTLLMGVLLGDAGSQAVTRIAGRTGPHWASKAVAAVPVASLRQINTVLGRNFVTKYGTKQGILVLGKQVPFGLGAAIGGAGNAAFAQFTIRSARRAFGPAPLEWPAELAGPAELASPADEAPDNPADDELALTSTPDQASPDEMASRSADGNAEALEGPAGGGVDAPRRRRLLTRLPRQKGPAAPDDRESPDVQELSAVHEVSDDRESPADLESANPEGRDSIG
ncbi:MAG: hypothetical protein ACK5MT_04235 [Actinomycetales bacterium]